MEPVVPAVESLEPRQHLADFSAAVNFAPAAARRAPGMLVDYGSTFDLRRGGLSYGWTTDHTSQAVERNLTPVQKNDTFIRMPTGSTWEIAVPNGSYNVYVVAGDLATPNERMALSVEGDVAIAGITRRAKPFLEGGVTVDVSDGKLTLRSAGAFGADKINYIGIQQVLGTPTPTPTPTPTSSTIKWVTGPDELTPRVEPEAIVVQGKLYVFSGYGDTSYGGDGWQPTSTYDAYDFATNKWTRLGKMPIGTSHAGVAVVGTDIWFAGGYTARAGTVDKQDIATTKVWIYHTTTNTWDSGPSLPQRRASGSLALVNNKLYHIAGEPADHRTNPKDVWALDLGNQSAGWVAKAPIPEGRTHHGVAVVNGIIYIIGGQHDIDANATFLKTAYAYNPATNTWKQLANLPENRSHLSSNTFPIGTKIYSFGGEYLFNKDTAGVLEYDTVSNTFKSITPLPGVRASGAAGYWNGKIVFTGGKTAGTFNNDTWIGTFV